MYRQPAVGGDDVGDIQASQVIDTRRGFPAETATKPRHGVDLG
jgi:hypothetical protein